jgi:hypothetical protein
MAITTSGTVWFKQHDGKLRAWMHLPRAKSQAAIRAFALALAPYTEADIVEVSYSYAEDLTIEGGGAVPLGDLGTLLLHGEIGKTRSKNLAIPAPKTDMFELVQGEGVLVKKIKGGELAALYSALTGETFQFIRGRLQR